MTVSVVAAPAGTSGSLQVNGVDALKFGPGAVGDPLEAAKKSDIPTVAFTKSYVSAQQTITVAGLLTLAHGLAVSPKTIQLELYCTTAEQNYAIGDTLAYYPDNTSSRGCQVYYDATNVYARFGSTGTMAVQNKTTGTSAFITAANWRLVVRAAA